MSRLRHVFTAARWVRHATEALVIVALLALAAVLVWVRQSIPAEPTARLALDGDELVMVSGQDWVAFQARDADPTAGVIFYPGGKAEPAAYAPVLRDLAGRGFLVVLLPMPLNLAFLGIERAAPVMEQLEGIDYWFVAGHSLGGVAASEFAERHPGQLAGLILWASYPAATSDLSQSGMPVLSIFATADRLTTQADIEAASHLLPDTTQYVVIRDGDHWNFGNFANVQGTAGISRDIQQAQVLHATQAFLEQHAGASARPPAP